MVIVKVTLNNAKKDVGGRYMVGVILLKSIFNDNNPMKNNFYPIVI